MRRPRDVYALDTEASRDDVSQRSPPA
jgi:hypothetical protein